MSSAMVFNDDEEPIAPASNAGKPVRGFSDVGKASVKPYYQKEAPVAASTVRVLLDVSSSSSTAGRAPLDLVVVLDVSGSMKTASRLEKLKSAMQFVIRKLTPMDRLSIVTFSSGANKLCALRAMSQVAMSDLKGTVDGLVAKGGTNIEAGLATGLQVLAGRRHTAGRTASVLLMSDGEETRGNAKNVGNPHKFPVYTLSFGADADMNLLKELASGGGTFNPVLDNKGMSMLDVFSQLMAGLLTVVVQDLYLILSKPTVDGHDLDKIVDVAPGDFSQETDSKSGTVTVKFGDLFSGEVRKVIVELLLKESTGGGGYEAEILEVEVSYPNAEGTRKKLPGQTLMVKRTPTASSGADPEELRNEDVRRQHAKSITAARSLADEKKLEEAREQLKKAQIELEDILENPMVAMLRKELQQLLDLMVSEELYKAEGRPYALAAELSHARQRFAARPGVDDGVRLFATPRMDAYLEQAKKFAENPDEPLPNADVDVEEEIKKAIDNRPEVEPSILDYYMNFATLLLQGIGNIVNRLARRA
ncbi:hypothetical protein ACP70R_008240 [Stipagrostis hirtigluma subsp. patula]